MFQVNEIVTLGFALYDAEVEAWITFPQKGVTHEEDPIKSSPSNTQWRDIKGSTRHFEKVMVPSGRRPKQMTGKVVETRTTDWGGELVLVDLGNKKRWFSSHLLNNPTLNPPPKV